MREITGRVLHGLDEFKLRLGHLSIICETAKSEGGSAFRLQRDFSARLLAPISVRDCDFDFVGRYLCKKRLCLDLDAEPTDDAGAKKYRYPDVTYRKNVALERFDVRSRGPSGTAPEIWFQDYCLAQPSVRSHVGAVTVRSKSTSKTGVSHLLDWARELGLVSSSGSALPIAEIVANEIQATPNSSRSENPYCLGAERIALGFAYVWADFDIFTEMIGILESESGIITRKRAAEIYIDAVTRLNDRTARSANVSGLRSRPIFELWRDLEKAEKKHRRKSPNTSSRLAWHRASSRFETLTDLGFLTKSAPDRNDKFEYRYVVTETTKSAADTLAQHEASADWFSTCFLSTLLGVETALTPATSDVLVGSLPAVAKALKRPTAPLPMIAVVVGLALRLSEAGTPYSLGAIQRGLRELAISQPDLARVSKGDRADSAGMIAFDLRRLEGMATDA